MLDRLVALGPDPLFLKGNHEAMLLDFVERPESGPGWFRHGGLETLMSYGVAARPEEFRRPETLAVLRDRLVEAMGPHLDFLRRLRLWHLNGNLLFVHAAADPERAPQLQAEETLLWGAPPERPRRDGIWVVHGHTVVARPAAEAGRVALDTGACYSGRLTAARIDAEGIAFMIAEEE